MDEEPPIGRGAARRPIRARVWLIAALGAFALGAAGIWLLAGTPGFSSSDLFLVKDEPRQPSAEPELPPPLADPSFAPSADGLAADAGALDERIAEMEQRVAQLDMQTQLAAGNAARAEGLLIALAARRALERGDELGYLADQLRVRFGAAQPRAVQTVIDASRRPVTLDRLLARLDGLAPALSEAPPEESVFAWLGREMGELFVVRREDSPSPAPERRLERARMFLESGRPEAAVLEVRNLPNAAGARGWIIDATRYAAAQRALEQLERAAILEPRQLRDGSGKPVEPVSAAAG